MLAACGNAAAPAAGPPAAKSPPSPVKVIASSPVTGGHGSTIVRLAVTDDGGAAVSADEHGGIRLWPALDGSREPISIAGAAPAALSIARDGDGFVVAVHDSARGVELVRIARTGEVRGRTAVAPEPEIVQVELTARGALVVRADHSIDLVDPRGAVRSHLVAAPGTRVRSLLVRSEHVRAIVDDGDGGVRARAIDLADEGARWGETSARLPIDPTRAVALSPDHLRVVGHRRGNTAAPVLVELATGKVVAKVCPEGEAHGFVDATMIACTIQTQVAWWSTRDENLVATNAEPIAPSADGFAFGGASMFGSVGHQLAIYAPDAQKFLGYGMREITRARPSAGGILIDDGGRHPLLLDAELHARRRIEVPAHIVAWTDLYPLDDRFVLAVAPRIMSADAWGSSYEVTLIEAATQTVRQRLPNIAASPGLVFEPATQLLLSNDGGTHLLLRFDPFSYAFTERIALVSRPILERVYLVDPDLADGAIAYAVHTDDRGAVLDEFRAADVRDGQLAARASYRMPGPIEVVDRAGNAYVRSEPRALFRHGVRTAGLATSGTVRPSPDGATVATIASGRIELSSTTTGRAGWSIAAWGATDVMWLATGEFVAVFPGGLAKVDLASGTFAERQCGWAFGLADAPFQTSSSAPAVCDVAP